MRVPALLGLTPRIGAVGWVVFALITAGLLVLTPGAAGRWQDWVAFACIVTAGAVAVTDLPGALPASRAWVSAVLCLIAATLPLFVETEEYLKFAPWYLRAVTEVVAFMVLRGTWLPSWIVAVAASGLVAALGEPIAIIRQLATLLAVQVLTVALARAAALIAEFRAKERSRVSEEEARAAAVATRRTELSALAALAEPMLGRLVSGEPSPQLRAEAGLLEAALRDTLRGRRLAAEPLASAVAAARRRGLEVVLLDDLAGTWSAGAGLEWAASRVEEATESVTVRLSAEGLTFVSGTSALRHEHDAVATTLVRVRATDGGD